MGFTRILFTVSHPMDPDRSAEVELLVDTGAMSSSVPREVLERLGVPKRFRRAFRLANGQIRERDVGFALFQWNGHVGLAQVVFAEPAVDHTKHTLEPADTYRL